MSCRRKPAITRIGTSCAKARPSMRNAGTRLLVENQLLGLMMPIMTARLMAWRVL